MDEVKRKFFGTLYNTYSFFALYANIDGFTYQEPDMPLSKRPEIDRWIISLLNTLVMEVESYYEDYEPTKAAKGHSAFCDGKPEQLVCTAEPETLLGRRTIRR